MGTSRTSLCSLLPPRHTHTSPWRALHQRVPGDQPQPWQGLRHTRPQSPWRPSGRGRPAGGAGSAGGWGACRWCGWLRGCAWPEGGGRAIGWGLKRGTPHAH